MDVLTLNDFYTVIEPQHLNELIEGDNTLLDSAELTAIGEVTGYIATRYDAAKCFDVANIPTNSGISTLIQKMVDIALFHLHSRITPSNIPDIRNQRYVNAINWLEKVSSGFIIPALPVQETEPTTPLRYGNSSKTENRYY